MRLRPLLTMMLQPRPVDRIASMADVAAWSPAQPKKAASGAGKSLVMPIAASVAALLIAGGAGFWYLTTPSVPPAPRVADAPDTPITRIANYTRYYDADDCLLLRPLNITEKSASIQALSASPVAAKTFEADFRAVNGFAVNIMPVTLSQQQCDFVTFVHRLDADPTANVKANLSKPAYSPSENVTLQIEGASAKHVEMLAVGSDGSVRNLTHLVNRKGDQLLLEARVRGPGAKSEMHDILVGIVTPERLEISAAFAEGVASSAILSSLASEIERKRLSPQLLVSVVNYR